MAIAVAEAARAAGLRDRPAPRRLPPRGLGRRCRRRPASAASATPTWARTSRASTRCAPGRTAATGVYVGVAAHSVRAVPGRLAGGDRRLRRAARARPPRPRPRAAARARGVPRRARRLPRSSCSQRTGLPRAAHEPDPRHPRRRRRRRPARRQRHDRRLLPDDRGQPRRRPLPGARLPRRRRPDRDRQRLQRARRPVRGGARARDAGPPRAPHPPRAARAPTATSGASSRRTGGRASGSTTPARWPIDRDHPDLRGRRRRGPAARRRDVRVGRGRGALTGAEIDRAAVVRQCRLIPSPLVAGRPSRSAGRCPSVTRMIETLTDSAGDPPPAPGRGRARADAHR